MSMQNVDRLPISETAKEIERRNQLLKTMSTVAQYLLKNDLQVAPNDTDNMKQLLELFTSGADQIPASNDGVIKDAIVAIQEEAPSNLEDDRCVSLIDFFAKDLGKNTIAARAYTCLRRDEIKTVDELVETTEQDLFRIRNMGKGCVNFVKLKLAQYGLSLKPEQPRGIEEFDVSHLIRK